MIQNLLILVILFFIMTILHTLPGVAPQESSVYVTTVLGFILLASFFLGKLSARLFLPLLTGYLLGGILFGPHGMGLFSEEHIKYLGFVDSLALCFIAFAAGGELELGRVLKRIYPILCYSVSILVIVSLAASGGLYFFLGGVWQDTLGLYGKELLYASLVMGVVAATNSPAAAVAVINETGARGTVAETTLGVSVVKDIGVMLLFASIVSWIDASLAEGAAVTGEDGIFYAIISEMFLSIMTGMAIGLFVIIYIRTLSGQMLLFTIGVAVISSELSTLFHLHEILVCITIGFVVRNFSSSGHKFIHSIEKGSVPIFVIFFSLTGSSLDLAALRQMWPIALSFFMLRMFLVWGAVYLPAALLREKPGVRRFLWGGFMAQAGISLGFAAIVRGAFPGWGDTVATILVAVIIINEVLGPIIFKFSLMACGEGVKGGYNNESDPGTGTSGFRRLISWK